MQINVLLPIDKVIVVVYFAVTLVIGLAMPRLVEFVTLLTRAAVVGGGTAISGGRRTLLGTVFGVLVLRTVGPALTFLHPPDQWERAVLGLTILATVGSDRL